MREEKRSVIVRALEQEKGIAVAAAEDEAVVANSNAAGGEQVAVAFVPELVEKTAEATLVA